jgi:hypothetical protein
MWLYVKTGVSIDILVFAIFPWMLSLSLCLSRAYGGDISEEEGEEEEEEKEDDCVVSWKKISGGY